MPDTGGNTLTPPSEEPLKPTVESDTGIGNTLLSGGSQEATQIPANTIDNITVPKTGDNGYLAEIWSLIISIAVMAISIIKRRR